MPHFRVDDQLHNHPKARKAGLEAMGLWALCGSFCTGYGTDGFAPEWYVKTWPRGAAIAKRLVAAKLWNPGEHDGEIGWWFHQFLDPGRNDSRAQVEADREKWRLKKQGQRGVSPGDKQGDSPVDKPRDSKGSSREIPGYTQPNPTQEESSGYLRESATESTARDSVAATPGAELVRRTIPRNFPAAIQTALRIGASALVKGGTDSDVVEEALREYATKTGVGPGILPSLAADVIKRRNGHTRDKPHKLRTIAEMAQVERAKEHAAALTADAPKELA